MAQKKGMRENFLIEFARVMARSTIYSGRAAQKPKYPDIEKIKENIKIYENPGNTLANAILMNQNPEVQKLMMQPYESVKELSSPDKKFQSIMGKISESSMPIVPTQVIPKAPLRRMAPNAVQMPRKANFGAPFSQLMPQAHQTAGVRMLPSFNKPNIVQLNPIQPMPAPQKIESATVLGSVKIDNVLADPAVQTLECPGPNKQMLIYKSGKIFPAKMTLTGDEIKNIVKDISEKTRIPLMSGVFKAAYGNLIITAVTSEFVGTRFIIQKKPQLPPVQPSSQYQ